MRNNSGFTIIELMTVIVIIAVLTALAVPNFFQFLPGYRLKSAARDLYSNLQLARIEAIKTNSNVAVNFTTNPDQYSIPDLQVTEALAAYKSGVNFDGPGSTPQFTSGGTTMTITFNSRGTCTAERYAYLSHQNRTAFFKVGVLSSGVVKLERL